ncbi:MAG: type VI secretion system tip protein TssI/VgrG [Polyangiaceae bacterium]
MSLSARTLLEIDGVSDPLRITRLSGEERVHAPFRFEVTVLSRSHGEAPLILDAESILGSPALLTLQGDPPRKIYGVVSEVHAEPEGYRVVLTPPIAALADVVDYRVFLGTDVVTIAKALLVERGIDVEERISHAPERRPQCVQAWESSLHFLSRILAEEGILWMCETEGHRALVVLSDDPTGRTPMEGDEHLPFGGGEVAGLIGAESVYGTTLRRAVATERVTLSDFHFQHPRADPTASAGKGSLEHYEPLAGALTAEVTARLAAVRLGERTRESLTLSGRSNCSRLAAGRTFVLQGAPHAAEDRTWLVIALRHDARDFGAAESGLSHEITFTAVPADKPYRPKRSAAPMAGGLQMGNVTGSTGSEIHTEPHGRVKARLRWDRRGSDDDGASTWIRPVQPPLSGGFFLPRVGWEVLFGFGRTAADEPYLLGRLDNGAHVPAASLPAEKVRSAFGSRTSPGGGSRNLLRMDDAAGIEGFSLVASKDLNERTENDKGTTIAADESVTVGGNHTEIVGIQSAVGVLGTQSITVGGNRDMTTTGQLAIQAASESVSIGGARKFQVGGDMTTKCASLTRTVGGMKTELAIEEQNRHVSGAHTVAVGGSWAEVGGLSSLVSVLGASTLTAGGPMAVQTANYSLSASTITETYGAKSESAGGVRTFSAESSFSLHAGGALLMKGAAAVFEAGSIEISASGTTIKLGGGTITIDGKLDTAGGSLVTGDEKHE